MHPLVIAVLAGVGFLVAYHTYGRWLGRKIFALSADAAVPSRALRDDNDYVPTKKSVVFGHHFTSIAGTGPIVGPAIAIMWGWVPALLWVVFGSIFIGAVHDFGSLVVSLRNQGKSVGDIAGTVINRRVRILFLSILFVCLLIVCAIFGLVIAAVFRQYPQAIFPCVVQIPIAVVIGLWLHRRGASLLVPSLIALAIMYVTTFWGDVGFLHTFNQALAAWPTWAWVSVLLAYGFVASVLPVWALLQPRDYINSLQLLSALGLIVVGLVAASLVGGAPPVEGAERVELAMVAPAWNMNPAGAPPILPFLFITIACGAVSGFHCLVSSGTSSKQLASEPEARFVGYGAMLTEGFLAVLVILACGAGLGLGKQAAWSFQPSERTSAYVVGGRHWIGVTGTVQPPRPDERRLFGWANYTETIALSATEATQTEMLVVAPGGTAVAFVGSGAFDAQYDSWTTADGLAAKVGAFVTGAGNFLAAAGLPRAWGTALMAVLVASFAGTTLDTAIRLQRYVVQELLGAVLPGAPSSAWKGLPARSGTFAPDAPRTGGLEALSTQARSALKAGSDTPIQPGRPHALAFLTNAYVATFVAVVTAAFLAAIPASGVWSLETAGTGGLILWPLFGASNQLLAGLAFAVILFYLRRRRIATWFLVPPMLFMLVVPAWAMMAELPNWWEGGRYTICALAVTCLALETWMVIEAALMYGRVKGVPEGELLGHGFEVAARRRQAPERR